MRAKTALITGANRGIGFEACRQLGKLGFTILLTARDETLGKEAAAALRKEGLSVIFHPLDVSSQESINTLFTYTQKEGIDVCVLVNNAGIFKNGELLCSSDDLKESMQVNFWGPYFLCQKFMPLMNKNGFGRIVNVSSTYGSFTHEQTSPPAYAISKAALNALTRQLNKEAAANVKVNSMCPGWVRTRMGGSHAPKTPEEGVDTLVWLATLEANGPSGGFFKDRKPFEW